MENHLVTPMLLTWLLSVFWFHPNPVSLCVNIRFMTRWIHLHSHLLARRFESCLLSCDPLILHTIHWPADIIPCLYSIHTTTTAYSQNRSFPDSLIQVGGFCQRQCIYHISTIILYTQLDSFCTFGNHDKHYLLVIFSPTCKQGFC
jgi:hypothetical protein